MSTTSRLTDWLLGRLSAGSLRKRRRTALRAAEPAEFTIVEQLEDRTLLSASAGGELFFSLAESSRETSLPGVGAVAPDDIVRYDGSSFAFAFRGSEVGLTYSDVDAFAFVSDSELLLSFASTVDVAGLGSVGSSDVVMFTATNSGDFSAGTFSMYLDGSRFGLSSSLTDNVIAVAPLKNGNLLLSTAGEVVVTSQDGSTLSARREDILKFTPSSAGPDPDGTWSLYLDGSDVGLSFPTESIDGIALGGDGQLFLSTAGSFFVENFGGGNEDVVEFIPSTLGEESSGDFIWPLFFNGNEVAPSLLYENANAIDLAAFVDDSTNNVPTADSIVASTREDTSVSIQLSGDDGDDGAEQALTYSIIDGPAHGRIIGFDPQTGQVTYAPDADFNGPDSFTYAVTDDGVGQPTSQPVAVEIEVTAVNDAPINTVPEEPVIADEDQPILIEGISVHDVDAHEGDGMLQVTLSVSFGTLTLSFDEAAELVVEGNGSDQVSLAATEEAINSILERGITYRGTANFSGADTLRVVTSDAGNTGEGNVLSDESQISITVRSVAEQYEALDRVFVELVETGMLDEGASNSLQAKLKPGKTQGQLGRMKALIRHVEALVKAGALNSQEGRYVIGAANTIRGSLSNG